MKFLKPLQLSADAARPDGYAIHAVADQWAELLPARVPLQFSFFRYLGFYVSRSLGGKATVVRSRPAIIALRVTIQNEDKVVFSDRVAAPFRNGVYYVQMIKLDQPGAHTVTVSVEGDIASQAEPLVMRSQVYEFMTLDECEELKQGPYAPLRTFVLAQQAQQLRDDAFQDEFLKQKTTALRRCDAKWWLKAYVEHTLDRVLRQRQFQLVSVALGRVGHKRKQDQPVRSADKREHDHLFERRRREWKRVRNGEIRMFTAEPLHAGATATVFSAKEMYHQLSQYAQV